MTPEREITINGSRVSEYYWAGKMVVYVNNRAVEGSFVEHCAELRKQEAEQPHAD